MRRNLNLKLAPLRGITKMSTRSPKKLAKVLINLLIFCILSYMDLLEN